MVQYKYRKGFMCRWFGCKPEEYDHPLWWGFSPEWWDPTGTQPLYEKRARCARCSNSLPHCLVP